MLVDDNHPVMEASIIVEYLDLHYPGPAHLIPCDPRAALEAGMLDRLFDSYISTPQQKFVFDAIRAPQDRDLVGVADAGRMLDTA